MKNNKIKVKMFTDEIEIPQKIEKGDWIDLRAARDIDLNAGEYAMIPLGIGMKLPDGYEAHILPRSSTFKKYGIIMTNSMGIIDNSYSGPEDQWHFPAYALRDTFISKGDRIAQFRIMYRQPDMDIIQVEELDGPSRGGFGSTGVK